MSIRDEIRTAVNAAVACAEILHPLSDWLIDFLLEHFDRLMARRPGRSPV